MIKAVVFDLDGTLLDTIPDIAGALNRALAACGWPTHSTDACKTFVGNGIFNAIRRALPAGSTEEDVQRVNTVYQREYPAHCLEDTQPYDGIHEMLTQLSARGILLGVLTNKEQPTARIIIDHYFPHIPFRCVCGRVRDDSPLKPDAAAAAPVLESLNLPPEEIAFVGDSGTDMTFAKNTGFLPVAAPWGYRSREELLECGAELVANDAAELLQVLLNRI